MAFLEKVGLAAVSGAAGGFIGTPADMINVRMQNDMKLPLAERRKFVAFPLKSYSCGTFKVCYTVDCKNVLS